MDPILEIARNKRLFVIEDAAQALGAEYKGRRRAGSMGDVGCFSFFPSKNLGALGDAGILTTHDATLAEKIRVLRVHGMKPKYVHKWIGGNFRIDTVQAAFLNVKFRKLDTWTRQRQENARQYEALFRASRLRGQILLPKPVYKEARTPHYHIYNQFVVRAKNRARLMDALRENQIGTEVYYPVPLHLQECFKSLGYPRGSFPEAERAAEETLALPIYPGLSRKQQAWVVNSIEKFFVKN
jgi:dTDP-4-amino-4,6-dideoxygalactose transaminase